MNCNDFKKVLKEANDAYRKGKPIMTDVEYDHLEDEFRRLAPNDDWFSRGVNDEKPKNREYVLPYPMMSLNKVKLVEDIIAWAKKYPLTTTFIITPKYDGLSLGMSENNCWTRGDGYVGQDCTEHVSNIYIKPNVHSEMTIRGEIIIDNNDWPKFKTMNEGAKSQRNSATGLINGDFDKNRIGEYSLLRVMPYEIMGSELNKDKQLDVLMNNNYVKIINIHKLTEEYLLGLYISWKKLYPIDGLVIDVNESEYRHDMEANGNPSYSIAYKHPSFSEVGYGEIERIERNINRNGIITPVIWLKEPINLSGADIQKVNGINMRYIHDWMLYPGETVAIIRSGEVIPKIIGVGDTLIPFRDEFKDIHEYEEVYRREITERKKNIKMLVVDTYDVHILENCPICGEPLCKLYGPDGDWCEYYCNNVKCKGKQFASVNKFFELCGVDGFGDKTFKQLMDNGVIENSFFDAFNIRYDDLICLEGWAEVSSKNFLLEMKKIKNELPFAKFLHATGWFADLGEKTLQKIIDNGLLWTRMDGSWRTDGLYEELLNVEGVQEITALKFIDGVELYNENLEILQNLNFKFKYIETPKNDGPLNGMIICATGFRDQEMFSKIKEKGGIIGDGVTKNTTCLIVKELSSTSSKMKKAEKMGIEILDINGFNEKYLK